VNEQTSENASANCRGGLRRMISGLWRGALVGIGIAVVGAGLAMAPEQQEAGTDIEVARSTIEKLVETRQVLSKEQQNWRVGKSVLEDRIDLVRSQIEDTRKAMSETREDLEENDAKRQGLLEENESLKEGVSTLQDLIAILESRTRNLLKRLPEPIRDHVKPLSQQIPEDPETADIPLANRYSFVIGVLNDINKYNGEIHMTRQRRKLPNGTTGEVATMYVGISQGYYVDDAGTMAGIGYPTVDGWEWAEANDVAGAIATAIAILKNEEAASFVKLPIEIN